MADNDTSGLSPEGQAAFNSLKTPDTTLTAPMLDDTAQPPADTGDVDVIHPSGQLGSVPAASLSQALASGYQRATPEQIAQFEMEKKYGTPGQVALTALEGTAKGALGPVATGLEALASHAGVPGLTPEEQAGRAAVNPGTHYGTEVGGFLAPAIATAGTSMAARAGIEGAVAAGELAAKAGSFTQAGLLSKLGKGIEAYLPFGAQGASYGSRVAAGAAKGSIEFAALQAGDEASKLINQDQGQTVGTAASSIGGAALIGGGFGIGAGIVSPLWKATAGRVAGKNLSRIKARINPDAPPVGSPGIPAEDVAGTTPTTEMPVGTELPKSPNTEAGQPAPTSMKDMVARAEERQAAGETVELPTKQAVLDASKLVPLDHPIHPVQLAMLGDQGIADIVKAEKEAGSREGKALSFTEGAQKKEINGKIDDAIQSLTPASVGSDAYNNGNRASELFTQQYQAEQEALKPVFQQLKDVTSDSGVDHLPGVLAGMQKAVPGVNKMYDVVDGVVTARPYNTSWGLDKSTYNAVKQAIEGLQEGGGGFEELSNVRSELSQNIDPLSQGRGPGQIRALKASMMDYIQNYAQKTVPDAAVRDTFKRWAINEQNREVIEKAFGASVGTPQFGAISKVKPEKILGNIFKDSATVDAAKKILPNESFNELLASHLAELKNSVTKDGVWSSNKFGTLLTKNQYSLGRAFSDNPKALQYINSATTLARLTADAPPVNPSGSAKTWWNMLNSLAHTVTHPAEGLSSLKEGISQHLEHKGNVDALNKVLSGSDDAKALALQKFAQQPGTPVSPGGFKAMTYYMHSVLQGEALSVKAVGNMFKADAQVIPQTMYPTESDRYKLDKIVKGAASNPSALVNTTGDLEHYMPGHAAAVSQATARITNYLNTLRPTTEASTPLGPKNKPNPQQQARYESALNIAQQPLMVLDKMSKGTLTSSDIQDLYSMYPDKYEDLKTKLVNQLSKMTEKDGVVPYKMRMSASLFLGQPLDSTMTPQSIVAAQPTPAPPQQQQGAPKGLSKPKAEGLSKMNKMYQTPGQAAQANRLKE